MNGRRDFLKLFGVGAVVVTVIGGVPSADAAVIVEPPKVELPESPKILSASAMPYFGNSDVVMYAKDRNTGVTTRVECRAFLMEMKYDSVDVSGPLDSYRRYVPGEVSMTFKAIGRAEILSQ